MQKNIKDEKALIAHWVFFYILFSSIIVFNIICHVIDDNLRIPLAEEQRILIRTIFYIIAIITFPITNLVRHILLRLNQTMPVKTSAQQRYFQTILICLSLIGVMASFGFVMFALGDGFNTLYIFSLLGILGFVLHRPKIEEFHSIIAAMNENQPDH